MQSLSVWPVKRKHRFACLTISWNTSSLISKKGVMKSLMGELTDPTNRAEAFALMPVTWSMGMSLGYVRSDLGESYAWWGNCHWYSPLIGGSLARPSDRFPNAFSTKFWKEFPYFLPCFATASVVFVVFVITALFLKEVRAYPTIVTCNPLTNVRRFQNEIPNQSVDYPSHLTVPWPRRWNPLHLMSPFHFKNSWCFLSLSQSSTTRHWRSWTFPSMPFCHYFSTCRLTWVALTSNQQLLDT